MTPILEQHIVELIKQGDQRGMSLLYDNFGPALYGCALKLTKDKDASSDILQDALIKIWNNSSSYNPDKAKFFTWCYGITRNTTIDYLRKVQKKQSKEIQLKNRDVYPIEDTINQDDKESLKRQISTLDTKYISVLDAVFYKGMTHMEAADYLDIPLGTFKTRMRAALIELRSINKGITILLWILLLS
ncbi:RNA polymerase sigma factor [Nonlabens ulvanivorans]|uniref:RNA polymerase sigma-70 factor n=1 Tax=Nonlabens ulvanivorans TaxID=906888 RepID=A0A084JYP3_NONUL|nr:sigma-70 family RNA polymerase sigma factor [Nonlabens ulvanivorans]KEZ94077.1 RNA polymerase sigma-70 factor [Nonlabens ulvanivorans]PRX13063.1 RNA polymerase sigma-70 factor (ECF subfamily) [Nonlabens ulvanivorans]